MFVQILSKDIYSNNELDSDVVQWWLCAECVTARWVVTRRHPEQRHFGWDFETSWQTTALEQCRSTAHNNTHGNNTQSIPQHVCYFQTFGKRQLMTVFPNANSKYSVPPQDSSLTACNSTSLTQINLHTSQYRKLTVGEMFHPWDDQSASWFIH